MEIKFENLNKHKSKRNRNRKETIVFYFYYKKKVYRSNMKMEDDRKKQY